MKLYQRYAVTAAVFGIDIFIVPPIVGSLIGGLGTQAIVLILALAASIYTLILTWENDYEDTQND